MAKIPVGILGATGMVGQRFIQLLEDHPWFEVAWLAASERSAGQCYGQAARWKLSSALPERVGKMQVAAAEPKNAPRLVLAALDAGIAAELEPRFAAAGHIVITNSSACRMMPDVPLVIPEVNADHIPLIERQATRSQAGGYIVTNPNCSAIGLVMALAPLHRQFGIEQVFVSTMQAVSGAGYPGVASLDILGNVIPYIPKEEEKLEAETRKLLGRYNGKEVEPAAFGITAHCNRVAVEDGHTESVSLKLREKASPEQVIACWRSFSGVPQELKLPSAPEQPLFYDPSPDRPQPRLDVNRGRGMTASIGRLRPCGLLDWKFTVLSHNTIRGAAGAALLNAELLKTQGLLS
jgi:aspartate-semialdehyde dehydrogenase